MRTSNILILAAFILGLAALLLHDSKLKAVYLSKSYKNPLQGFAPLEFKNFNVVDVRAAGVANVKIVQGPFKVMVKANQTNFIKLSQKGDHLIVDAAFNNNEHLYDRYYEGYRVYISCPSLSAVKLDDVYTVDGRQETDTTTSEYYSRKTIIHGFKQDSLSILQDNGSYLIMDSNSIGTMNAVLGASPGGAPVMVISSGNRFTNARFDLHSKSYLELVSPIPNLQYTLDDSAKIYLTGAVNRIAGKK